MGERKAVERRYAEFLDVYLGGFQQDLPIYLDLAAKNPAPILEVGCGTGRVTQRLARAGYEVLGIDVHRPMVEIAREKLRPYRDHARVSEHDLRGGALTTRFHVALVTL